MIAFPLPAAAAELPAGVQQILQQSELTPDKLVHITLQGLLQTLGRGTLTVTEIGAETALGVCKRHEIADETAGYMNLMLN